MELVTHKKLYLVSGRISRPLAESIAAEMGESLGEPNIAEFANGGMSNVATTSSANTWPRESTNGMASTGSVAKYESIRSRASSTLSISAS